MRYTRRGVLTAGLRVACASMGLAGVACSASGPRRSSAAQSAVKPVLDFVSPSLYSLRQALEAGFAKDNPKAPFTIRLVAQAQIQTNWKPADGPPPPSLADEWARSSGGTQLLEAAHFLQGNLDLTPYVRDAGIDLGALLPSLVDAVRVNGGLPALPLVLRPVCLRYPAGVAGKVGPTALATWAGMRAFLGTRTPVLTLYGPTWTTLPTIWPMFILGFRGRVAAGGLLDLGNAGAAAGLDLLTKLLSQPAVRWCTGGSPSLEVDVGGGASAPGSSGYRYLPFPVFPAGRIVPIQQLPFAIQPNGFDTHDVNLYSAYYVRFVAWLYQAPQQRLLMAAGFPPVVADPELEKAWDQGTELSPALRGAGLAAALPMAAMRDVQASIPWQARFSLSGNANAADEVGWLLRDRARSGEPLTAGDLATLSKGLNGSIGVVNAFEKAPLKSTARRTADPQLFASALQGVQAALGITPAPSGSAACTATTSSG